MRWIVDGTFLDAFEELVAVWAIGWFGPFAAAFFLGLGSLAALVFQVAAACGIFALAACIAAGSARGLLIPRTRAHGRIAVRDDLVIRECGSWTFKYACRLVWIAFGIAAIGAVSKVFTF